MEINANTEVKAGLETNHIIDLSDRLYKIILAIIGLVAIFIIGQMVYDFKDLPQNYPQQITVTGEGKAYAKPDIAVMSFGVTTEAEKSQDAVNQNNEKMNAITQAIKALGVQDKDMRTTLYQLNPTYGSDRPVPLYPYSVNNNHITGYSLVQQVEVKMRDFDKINEIIDTATSKGANAVGSLQFTIDDPETVRSEARAKAIKQAKEKALTLVSQAGLRIEKLVSISEGNGPSPAPLYKQGFAGTTAKESAPSIQAGQLEVDSTVTLTYRIK